MAHERVHVSQKGFKIALKPHETRSKRDGCNKLGPILETNICGAYAPPRLELPS